VTLTFEQSIENRFRHVLVCRLVFRHPIYVDLNRIKRQLAMCPYLDIIYNNKNKNNVSVTSQTWLLSQEPNKPNGTLTCHVCLAIRQLHVRYVAIYKHGPVTTGPCLYRVAQKR